MWLAWILNEIGPEILRLASLSDAARWCGRLRTSILFFVPLLDLLVDMESGALKPLVDARDFELTTAGVGDIVKASMTHRTKGKLVLTVSKQ